MDELRTLLSNNRRWAARLKAADPEFFSSRASQQTPRFVWVGCSDSRVPSDTVVGLKPGDLFVHRNIGNQIVHSDLNAMSVLQFAIDVLRVRHIIVCGHFGCGAVRAALGNEPLGLVDQWLRHVRDVRQEHHEELAALPDERARADRLCELNTLQQVQNIARTGIAQDAWRRGQFLAVHGWVYDIHTGLVNDLGATVDGPDGIPAIYRLGDSGSP